MMKTMCVCVGSLLLAVAAGAQEVKLAGVQVVFDDGGGEFDGFKTYNAERGMGVSLLIRSADKQMVMLDDEKAAVKIGGVAAKCRFFDMGSSASKDRKVLRVEFVAEGKPQVSPDGTVPVVGEIPVVLATGKAETRSEPFKLQPGTAVAFADAKAGMPNFKMGKTGKPDWGDEKFKVDFSVNTNPKEIAGVKFYTKDGKPVESKQGGWSWGGFGGMKSGSMSFSFKEKHDELILAVESWTGREEKKVKVDLKAGLVAP